MQDVWWTAPGGKRCRAARSLLQLRAQINSVAPRRSTRSDGMVGDLAHSTSKSEHNPNAAGVVRAFDVTHDPAGGMDGNVLSADLVAAAKAGDRRVLYVIWNRRIWSYKRRAEGWRRYTGTNGHTKHVHLSVAGDYDSMAAWDLGSLTGGTVTVGEVGRRTLHLTDPQLVGSDVAEVAHALGLVSSPTATGVGFGPRMDAAVRAFQAANGLDVDGRVGPATKAALLAPQSDQLAPAATAPVDTRTDLERFLDDMDEKQLRAIIRDEARAAVSELAGPAVLGHGVESVTPGFEGQVHPASSFIANMAARTYRTEGKVDAVRKAVDGAAS